jgi:general secretion pathway protein C
MSTVSWLEGAGLPARHTQLVTRAPQLAVWALAAAMGVQAAFIVTHLAGSGVTRLPAGQLVNSAATAPALDLAALGNVHLFGAAAAPVVDDSNAPATNMPLILTGIIAASDPKDGLAIIGTTASNAKIYPVGERVPGNARVHAVYTDRVLLERDGVIEALRLPQKFGNGSAPPPIGLMPSPLDRVQRVMTNEPGLLSDVLRPQPVFVDGKLRGYRVNPGVNARDFGTLGLRNGDLVVAVNGTLLDDPARGNEILNSLGNADQARVTVMRNGQQQDITLNMAQVATQAEQLSNSNAGQSAAGAAGSDPAAVPPESTPGTASPGMQR